MEEKNLAELKSWDLWGVPSFQYGDQQWWGQDRFRSIEDAIVDDLMRD